MQLKRYETKELQDKITDIFYNFLASESEEDENLTNAHLLHKDHEDKLELYRLRQRQFTEMLQREKEPLIRESLSAQLDYIKRGIIYISEGNIKNQKKWYKEIHSTNFTRSFVRMELDKKINSFYDDFCCEVVFYDDVCTLNGKFDEYSKLQTKEERLEFLKKNTQITHIGLAWVPNGTLKAIIEVQGELNYNDSRVTESNVTLLPRKFSNFEKLTLADTSEISNNDLKQFIQTKIDLDKENLRITSSQVIRGDKYEICEPNNCGELFIRYTCRGTGRVYFNRLNLANLRLSPEFVENDHDSYAKAWWNINTLGGDVAGKPVIRC